MCDYQVRAVGLVAKTQKDHNPLFLTGAYSWAVSLIISKPILRADLYSALSNRHNPTMGALKAAEWRKLPLSLTELCIDTTLRCGQSFRWRKLNDEWYVDTC